MSPRGVIRTLLAPDPTTGKRLSCGRSILVAGVMLFGGGEAAWSEERIGGAEIVINIVQGDLPSGSTTSVAQGDAVYQDEGVRTRVDSKARVILLDQTNVTIGPSSTIKLDRFVYDGSKKSGKIVLNLAKGTCRLIVGDADKRAYTIVTPTAAIGIRE
jgi:hypothetical protein